MPSDFNDDDVLHLLELVLAEPDPTLARLCVQVADYVGAPVASVADRVKLPPHATRTSAMHALVELCGYGCVDLALRLVVHTKPALCLAALESLEDVDDARITPALLSLPPEPDPEVQRTLDRIRASLACLDVRRRVPERPGPLTVSEARLARLLVGRVPTVEIPHACAMRTSEIAAVRKSAQACVDDCVAKVLATLKCKPTVEALTLLQSLNDSRAVAYLQDAGLSPDQTIGAAQVKVLGSLRDEGAVKLLINWLAEPSGLESLIWQALVGLGQVASPHVISVLPTLDVEKRVVAARMVAAWWPQQLLLALLNDASVEVRLAAVTTISEPRPEELSSTNASVAAVLLVGVIARSHRQSADEGRVCKAARVGIETIDKLGFRAEVIEALDAALRTADIANADLLLHIRENLKSLQPVRHREGILKRCAPVDLGDEEEQSPKITDHVSFSVTSPLAVAPDDTFTLGVWAHSDGQRQEVLTRAQWELGRAVRVASRGPVQVPREALLTIRVRIPAFGTTAEDTVGWFGQIGHAAFLVTVPADAPPGPVSGSLGVHLGAMRISRLDFLIEVGARTTRIHRAKTLERRVRRGFASYASDDRDEVMGRIQGMLKIAPALDIFVDMLSLRSGELWKERLKQEIAARDVMYLFWSSAASRSEMVEWEWRWALHKRGLEFIDPVPLQPPSIVPPPAELASLHFSDWTLAFKR